MNTTIDRKQRAKTLPVQLNGKTIDGLFEKYEEIGFLYPEKKALLKPHFEQISHNWEILLNSEEELLWMMTTDKQQKEKGFASITTWKQGNYGLFAQHLVSTGNPMMSLKILLAAQNKAEFDHDESDVQSCQNWFRPNNRYAYRIFASIYDKLGVKKSSLLLFHYLHLSLNAVDEEVKNDYEVEDVLGKDEELIAFVKQQYGEVFVRGEELDQADIQMKKIGKVYQKYDLVRRRKLLKIRDSKTQEIVACVIANRGPLGLNFSFLESRAYYILAKKLEESQREMILKSMNTAIKPFYTDFELQTIPIVTDDLTSKVLQQQHAVLQRKYMQSIWLREGFTDWYNHIYSFLQRIEKRYEEKRIRA